MTATHQPLDPKTAKAFMKRFRDPFRCQHRAVVMLGEKKLLVQCSQPLHKGNEHSVQMDVITGNRLVWKAGDE